MVSRAQYWLAVVFVVGWSGVVCGGLGTQFIGWEYPCPLCLVQRMFMLLAALGGAYIVRRGMTGTIAPRDYATGWGLAVVACVAGGFTSWRQTMLHILPGDPGYGGPVLGLHLYVWALILFVAAIATIGVVTSFASETAALSIPVRPHRIAGTVAIGFLALVIGVNLVAAFLEEGLHWYLPDDPQRYQLFYDLGILH
ncbi:disulfide bond formation protein B [Nocardia sp. CDC159]|uniref:Disulfide bond formation protein B n=1 Tax=Nocardia pulmonis TaxID=2951408 RepID=A0A9X2IWN4_9NOCA|nr:MULTISPECIES: disulfide bond formation protein B [Nocardia]MCM6773005.1 disulfide bond formation protein B [Nocardia pulmonis]MCM6785692.1 disulfide bond formation protein B [Nocardia sp. CDC159]